LTLRGGAAKVIAMPRFADQSVAQLLEALAAPTPTPGGGTASAIASAIGTALLMMVAGLARSRTNTDQEKAALAGAASSLVPVRERLTRLADTDAEAFDQVMSAYRLPKATDQDKEQRKAAVQEALRVASTAPLEVVRATREAIALARPIAANGNRSAASDVRVALELLEAAAAGAAANVEINIVSIDDAAFREAAAAEIVELTNAITEDAAAARASLAP
jgi:formiminotetrahydrofolate cyclodeaminase